MLARLAAFIVWALVAGSIVFWGLRVLVRAPVAPPHAIAVTAVAALQGDLTRLLGAAPVAPAAAAMMPEVASRFRLQGVMAPKHKPAAEPSGQGVALISVDGKPPRAFAIGSRLDRDLVLQSVGLRAAFIGPAQGGASVKLELPALPLPVAGKLPAAAAPAREAIGAPPSLASPGRAVPPPAPVSPSPHPVSPRRDSTSSR